MEEMRVITSPKRILLGPGPSNVPQEVLQAIAEPTVGYMDPYYLEVQSELQQGLRKVFRTDNDCTFAVSGPGTAAMECAVYNVLEPGRSVLCLVHGYFGNRISQMAERTGARVFVFEKQWGEAFTASEVQQKLKEIGRVDLITVVHGETSTGVLQPLPEIAEVAHKNGSLLLVDTVASLGGVAFEADAWGCDIVYSGSQKCLSAPPGISPITFSDQAKERCLKRSSPCSSWNLDLGLNFAYWQRPASYHHTGPINLTYALHAAIRRLFKETLEGQIERIANCHQKVLEGFQQRGFRPLVASEYQLPTLTTVSVPQDLPEAQVRSQLLERYGIEIAGGLGPWKGRAWRIGLMGWSAQQEHVDALFSALDEVLS